MKISLNPDVVKALLTVAGKHDIRYYLNGVCVDATGETTVLVSTDGHRLLAVPVCADDIEEPISGEFIIPRDVLEMVKPIKAGKHYLRMTLEIVQPEPTPDPERPGVTIVHKPTFTLTGATTASGTVVDGRYPDWKRVMPSTANNEPAQFNPDYVADFGKACKLLGGKHFTIHHNGNGGSLVSNLGHGALGVVMPTRHDETSHPGLPTWAVKPEPAKLQAVA
jgi:DNA polymerase-3 subunit beta